MGTDLEEVVRSATAAMARLFEGRTTAERRAILAALERGGAEPAPYGGVASCYVEFGDHLVGRVDADFSGPTPTGPFAGPSLETAQEKKEFASTRRWRWFGR